MAPRRTKAAILMDAAKRRLRLRTDYALAKAMGVEPAKLGTEVRSGKRRIPLHVVMKIGHVLEKDPITLIAQVELEREKDKETRKWWRTLIDVRTAIKGHNTALTAQDETTQEENQA